MGTPRALRKQANPLKAESYQSRGVGAMALLEFLAASAGAGLVPANLGGSMNGAPSLFVVAVGTRHHRCLPLALGRWLVDLDLNPEEELNRAFGDAVLEVAEHGEGFV